MSHAPRILLFEDDKTLRGIFRRTFESFGYNVEDHEDPYDVMHDSDLSSRLHDFAGIWTDWTMIRMHGPEAAHKARELGFSGHIALCTGNELSLALKYQLPDYTAGTWRGPLFNAIHAKPIYSPHLEHAISTLRDDSPAPKDSYTTSQ